MFHFLHGKVRRIAISMSVILFLVAQIITLVPTQYANASGVPVFDATVNASIWGVDLKNVSKKAAEESFLGAVMGSLVHGASYFTRRLAYDTAVYVASGGNGQNPLAFWQSGNDYLTSTLGDALADSIGELGKPYGLNLCEIPDLRFQVFLQFGLLDLYGGTNGPQPNCTFQQLTNGGLFDSDAWKQRYFTEEGLAETFSAELNVRNTDFGNALSAIQRVDEIREQQKEGAVLERQEGEGIKAVTDRITGNVKTPAQVVKEETKAVSAKHQGELSAIQTAGIYGSSLKQLPAVAASVFLNTLTSQLLDKLLTDGLFSSPGGDRYDPGLSSFSFYASPGSDSRERAQNALTFLFTQAPEQLTNYPILGELAACPEEPGLNNCVIDSNFHQALAQAKLSSENALTIQEAIDEGKLNGSWPLISPRHQDHGDIVGCQVGKYCYSNIQKLRKLRVLPIGFEVAALRSDPERPWTLQEVVDGFEDCARPNPNDNNVVEVDEAHPFCHLIDPNWVLMIPDARCDANVYGPQLIREGTALRRKECVDISTCLAKDGNGTCIDYGYCTQEKNVWKIGGDSCPAEYNTCTTYTNTETNKINSYLARTVDYGECSIDTVGCRAYSLEQANGNWVASPQVTEDYTREGRNQTIHFSAAIVSASDTCDSASDGCHGFYAAERDTAGNYLKDANDAYIQDTRNPFYMKKAPDYLGCYDTDRSGDSPEINWPVSIQQTQNEVGGVSQNPACDAYASVCVEEEVGCNAYTPAGGGVMVPGVIGAANQCAAECVGYDVFRQEETVFEDTQFPLYFIPTDGQTCSEQYVGCDEFTNIDEVSRGGEGLEYYTDLKYCERPQEDGGNVATYYSWEGSLSEGLALKTHTLRPLTQADQLYIDAVLDNAEARAFYAAGGPAYADDSEEALMEYFERCNEQTYNLKINDPFNPAIRDLDVIDCRAIYLDDATVYYRILSELITVSDACRPLRKTETNIYIDNALPDNLCTGRHGTLVDGVCTRCKDGGEYRDGVCIYQAMTGENESLSCPAQFNGCRAYTGNAAGNIREIFNDDFEPGGEDPEALVAARADWSTGQVVAEATDVGLHSLFLENGRGNRFITSTIQVAAGEFYEYSFWARGRRQNVRIRFRQPGNSIVGIIANNVSIGDVWQEYRFGPIEIQDNFDPSQPIEITMHQLDENGNVDNSINGNALFIDHVRLTRVEEKLALIKDSWQTRPDGYDVPLSCDANPADGLPGAALGCRAYEEEGSKGVLRYATGFERLCREDAAGCQPLWDTFNTVEGESPERAHVYNVWCEGAGGDTCEVVVDNTPLGSCDVVVGEPGCYVPEIVLPESINFDAVNNAGYITASSVFIPEDTATSTPIFLAYREEFSCSEAERGCMIAGQERQELPDETQARSFSHSDMIIKNDPALYADTLCRDGLVGCSEFAHGSEISYFKDPQFTGGGLCTYREASRAGDPYGWMLEGVGTCSNNGDYCTDNAQCGEGNICENIGQVPCYEDYVLSGGEHNLWSNESQNYDSFVGQCPNQYNLCTELVDPQDTSSFNPEGRPYYVIFNEEIQRKQQECEQVSLREGCVLFDKTDLPNKIYDSGATYELSESQVPPYGFVDPVRQADPAQNDTNLLLKVNRERECSEWLACKTSVRVTSPSGGQDYICQQYKACEAFDEEGGSTCRKWVDDVVNVQENSLDPKTAIFRLTYDQYVQRGTSWYDAEFSGYSLYNKYQIANMAYMSFDFEKEVEDELDSYLKNKTFIAYTQSDQLLRRTGNADLGCKKEGVDTDWQACGIDLTGVCYADKCIYPIDKGFEIDFAGPEPTAGEARAFLDELVSNSCKGAPEEDSPFGVSFVGAGEYTPRVGDGKVRKVFNEVEGPYNGANFCQDGECSCAYVKAVYKNSIVDYLPIGKLAPEGICTGGGKKDGTPCDADVDCRSEVGGEQEVGTCSRVEVKHSYRGFDGYCLEPDLSRPVPSSESGYQCLTWLPIQVSASRGDIYNSDVEAGYDLERDALGAESSGQTYCVASESVLPYSQTEDEMLRNALVRDGDPGRLYGEELYNGEDGMPPNGKTYCNANVRDTYFHDLFCGYWDRTPFNESQGRVPLSVYDFMKNWSRKNISPAATVLRVEEPGLYSPKWRTDGSGNNREHFGLFYTASPNTDEQAPYVNDLEDVDCGVSDESPACTIHALIPTSEGANDWGVYMHPPRFLPPSILDPDGSLGGDRELLDNLNFLPECFDGGQYLGNCDGLYREFTYQQQGSLNVQRTLSTYPLLPGGVRGNNSYYRNQNPFDPLAGQGLIATVAWPEESLHLDQLSRVYFIPTAFPWGAEGENPSLFTDDLYIDFLALESGEVADRNVPTAKGNDDASRNYFPERRGEDRSGRAHTYIAQPNSGFMRYPNAEGLRARPEVINYDRNTIDKRYVLVYASQGAAAGGLVFDGDTWADPFNTDRTRCLHETDNWFAIGMDFNAEGEFLGYISRWCSGAGANDNADNSIQMAVVATMNSQCLDLASVYNDDVDILQEASNKAWTNRLWQGALLYHPLPIYRGNPAAPMRLMEKIPFGSIPLSNDNFTQERLSDSLRTYFRFPEISGMPYSCGSENATCRTLLDVDPINNTEKRALAAQYPSQEVSIIEGKTAEQGITALNELFAYVFTRAQIREDDRTTVAVEQDVDSAFRQNSIIPGEDLLLPQIYSLNPATCGDGMKKCVAAEKDNMTINGRNSYISPNGQLADYDDNGLPDEDFNGDGFPDAILGIESYSASLQFFAFADDNKMPIRRVMVDWGDNSDITNQDRKGLYKNRKPLCEEDDEIGAPTVGQCTLNGNPTNLTCDLDKNKTCPTGMECVVPDDLADDGGVLGEAYSVKRFGNLPRACDEEYFEFLHEYSCGPADEGEEYYRQVVTLEPNERIRLQNIGLDQNDFVCVFTPKVQVLDNWGWCNGSCTRVYNGEGEPNEAPGNYREGCYEEFPVTIIDDDTGEQSIIKENQCAVGSAGTNAWTSYQGKIIVIPPPAEEDEA